MKPSYKLGNLLEFDPAVCVFRQTDPLRAIADYWTECPFTELLSAITTNSINRWTIHHWRSYSKPLMDIISDSIQDYTSQYYYKEPKTEKSISITDLSVIVNQYIVPMYSDKWTRLYNAMFAEYNPIHNYDMTETETRTNDGTISTDNTQSVTGSGTANNQVYGYNSSEATPAESSNTNTTTTTTDTGNAKTSADESRSLTRSGNIGVTTSAQMIEGELELRAKVYLGIVIADLDDALTLGIYDDNIGRGCY